MFLVIINTILDSVYNILYKKALSFSNIKPIIFQYIWEIFILPVIIWMIIYWFNLKLFLNPIIVWGFFISNILFIFYNSISQNLYKEEKLATLLPYEKINNFIVVIFGFIFFNSPDDSTSLLSFIICLFSIVLTTIFSVDFKNMVLPKNFPKIILVELLKSIQLMVEVYILKNITYIEYIVIIQVIYFIYATFLIIYWKDYKGFKKINSRLMKYRVIWHIIWFSSFIIDIFLLKELWVIISTLLWFFWWSLSIAIAYFFLKETPKKKDIFLWVIITILAWVWYYFK